MGNDIFEGVLETAIKKAKRPDVKPKNRSVSKDSVHMKYRTVGALPTN